MPLDPRLLDLLPDHQVAARCGITRGAVALHRARKGRPHPVGTVLAVPIAEDDLQRLLSVAGDNPAAWVQDVIRRAID